MKPNYQLVLEKTISEIQKKDTVPSLLLHSCCAPCSSYVIEYLSNYFNITIYYYNPNISPVEEYNKRKQEQIKFINEFQSKNKLDIIDVDYNYDDFLNVVNGLENEPEGGARCSKCYLLRLEETAKKAKQLNYDYFATTLTVSPYKNSKKQYNIKNLCSEFKKKEGYKRSIELAKKYNLYRQNYCGCIFSKNEREEYEKNK